MTPTKPEGLPELQPAAISELLPCPFCGGEASGEGRIRYSRPLDDTEWEDGSPVLEAFYVNCVRCGAVGRSGIVGGFQTREEAVRRWNTRTPTKAATAEGQGVVNAELIRALRWLRSFWHPGSNHDTQEVQLALACADEALANLPGGRDAS